MNSPVRVTKAEKAFLQSIAARRGKPLSKILREYANRIQAELASKFPV